MADEPVYLTDEEASSLKEAVGRIVSTGIRVSDTELEPPNRAERADPPAGKNLREESEES